MESVYALDNAVALLSAVRALSYILIMNDNARLRVDNV